MGDEELVPIIDDRDIALGRTALVDRNFCPLISRIGYEEILTETDRKRLYI